MELLARLREEKERNEKIQANTKTSNTKEK